MTAAAVAMMTTEQVAIVAAAVEAGTATAQEVSQAATASRWDSDEMTEIEAMAVVHLETTTTGHRSGSMKVDGMTILANEGTRSSDRNIGFVGWVPSLSAHSLARHSSFFSLERVRLRHVSLSCCLPHDQQG